MGVRVLPPEQPLRGETTGRRAALSGGNVTRCSPRSQLDHTGRDDLSKFKVTKTSGTPEEVEADGFRDVDQKWIDFYKTGQMASKNIVLRVRADDVERVDKI